MRDGLFGQVPIVRTSRVDGRKIIEGEWRDSEAHERPVHVVTLKDVVPDVGRVDGHR